MARVLILEDDNQARYLYEQALKFQNMEVRTASDSSEALEILAKEKIDIILLDLLLPGESGLDFLHKYRDRAKEGDLDLPIIIVTHLQDDSVKQQAMILGVSSYLNKSEHTVGDVIRAVRSRVKA